MREFGKNLYKRGSGYCDPNERVNMTWQQANESGIFFKTNGKRCIITRYNGKDTELTLPDYIEGKIVREIGKEAFANSVITNVILPDNLLRIGKRAFYRSALKSICLPRSMKSIGDEAFAECSFLTRVGSDQKNLMQVDIGDHVFYKTPYTTNNELAILGNVLIKYNSNKKIVEGISQVERIISGAFEGKDFLSNRFEKVLIYSDYMKIDKNAFCHTDYLWNMVRKNTIFQKPDLYMCKMWLHMPVFGLDHAVCREGKFYVCKDDLSVFQITFTDKVDAPVDRKLVLTLDMDAYLRLLKSCKNARQKICYAYSYLTMDTNAKEIQSCLDVLSYDKQKVISHLMLYHDLEIIENLVKWDIITDKLRTFAIQKAESYGFMEGAEWLKNRGTV